MKLKFIILIMILFCNPVTAISDESEDIIRIQNAAEWEAGVTSVSGLTSYEKLQMCGAMIRAPPVGEKIVSAPLADYPTAFNWHDINGVDWMSPVRHQGSCGSCWAFAVVGAVEGQINVEENKPNLDFDLSEQHLVASCCSNCGDCGGGYPTSALSYIQRTGIPNETCYRYLAQNSGCSPCADWIPYQITNYKFISNDIDSFKHALQEGPLVVVLRVSEDWFYYQSGVYEPTGVLDDGAVCWANHAVVLVGWQDVASIDTGGYWIVKNSWGTGWGEKGYGKVKYGDLEQYNYGYAVEKPIIPSPEPAGWIIPESVKASSYYGNTWKPEFAIDNNTQTAWFTNSVDKKRWLEFDLGNVTSINAARFMTLYKYYIPITVAIEVSVDGETWDTVVNNFVINEYGGFVEISFAGVNARYIKMTEIEITGRYGTCSEFNVRTCENITNDMVIVINGKGGEKKINVDVDNVISIIVYRDGERQVEWFNVCK